MKSRILQRKRHVMGVSRMMNLEGWSHLGLAPCPNSNTRSLTASATTTSFQTQKRCIFCNFLLVVSLGPRMILSLCIPTSILGPLTQQSLPWPRAQLRPGSCLLVHFQHPSDLRLLSLIITPSPTFSYFSQDDEPTGEAMGSDSADLHCPTNSCRHCPECCHGRRIKATEQLRGCS